MDDKEEFIGSESRVFHIFDPKCGDVRRKHLADFTFWKQMALEKAAIEDQFSKRMMKWVENVQLGINNITTFKEPALQKSLEAELRYCNHRAEQAECTSMAYTRLHRHLNRGLPDTRRHSHEDLLHTYKHLLKALDHINRDSKNMNQKLQRKTERLNEQMAANELLNESLQEATPELHEKAREIQDKIEKIKNKLQKISRAKCRVLEEVLKQSDVVMNSWLQMESEDIDLLIKEWKDCLTNRKTAMHNIKEFESDPVKILENVSVSDYLANMASQNTKELSMPNDFEFDDYQDWVATDQKDSDVSLVKRMTISSVDSYSDNRVYNFNKPSSVPDLGLNDSMEEIDCTENNFSQLSPPNLTQKTFLSDDDIQKTNDLFFLGAQRNKVKDIKRDPLIQVVAVKDFKKRSHKEISLRCGQILRMCPMGIGEKMAFGMKKGRLSSKQRSGYFPSSCVIPC